ncbi:hypothetical protein Desaci_1270 [Desulfosporosinus acidiphilus SJ4]|uniref:Uncharacterized protein n=1 Tax=Desulfosporosinus acidiphilus (strain DSM 22704 / JCM 16185 / SJ4) TaxID=646529 RepID=I4D3C3_DESAJ|nr:hypothetical protein [Desulfosporosinus acidiphilus]AFM40297.1 hypothetical protein Desaci_1270 [Desulfosporosinus acidiphilus SJ4]
MSWRLYSSDFERQKGNQNRMAMGLSNIVILGGIFGKHVEN